MTRTSSNPWTVVDLFSGCCGLSHGFERAGFHILGAFDAWKPAIETYRRNFTHPAELCELTEASNLPRADVFIGGPPCQGFSSAGLRKQNDDRNTLVGIYAKLVCRYLPTAFVFENVEGFLTGSGGKFVFELLDPLIEAGYRIHLRKVNAANFGVPQHRKRVLAIGGLGWDPVFPVRTHSSRGAPGASLFNNASLPFAPSMGDALQCLPAPGELETKDIDHEVRPFSKADVERARLLKPGQRMRDLPEEHWHDSYRRRAYRRVQDGIPSARRGGAPSGLRRLSANEPSKAITGGALREFVHPDEDRPLTIRECARLQTFPDDFRFIGNAGDKMQMIGNAVPPVLAHQIALSLACCLPEMPACVDSGALLSFHPTPSAGMSPALQEVTEAVTWRFGSKAKQDTLCL